MSTKHEDLTAYLKRRREETVEEARRNAGIVPDADTPSLQGSLDVAHVRGQFDVYGGRSIVDMKISHMGNVPPGTTGWLGNPFGAGELGDGVDGHVQRQRRIAAFWRAFHRKVERDDEFRAAVEGLRGQRVACFCRGAHEDLTTATWCHLDVVRCWLDGDLRPIYQYLRGGD